MDGLYNWAWVEARVAETGEAWNQCASDRLPEAPSFSVEEQRKREKAYDEGLNAVERELKRARGHRTAAGRIETQRRVIAMFARFSGAALDLNDDAIELLTHDFLPAGTRLGRWARQFDPDLSMPDIIQACRNAWTACGLQPLLGERVELTSSILGYSLLYPYTDNYLDGADITVEAKLGFSRRFRKRLQGEGLVAENEREATLWALVELIERQYPREHYPDVFDCLLAIHLAQEHSIAQVKSQCTAAELLPVSCAKGGTSVLADACIARGWLNDQESRFAFDWGVLLQLGDDLQDVREDMQRGSMTLFSGPAAADRRLDDRVIQLLTFSERVSDNMEQMPYGTPTLKALLRMSWRSLILMAVAESYQFFSPAFLKEAERFSPFRFDFLRKRREKLTGRRGLYAMLFDAMVEPLETGDAELPIPAIRSPFSSCCAPQLPLT